MGRPAGLRDLMSMPVLEHRRGGSAVLFVLVVVAHIILISAQVTSKSGMPVLQSVAFGLVAELQRGGAGVVDAVSSLWSGYVDLRGMRDENGRLRKQLADTQIRLQQERALAQRSGELRACSTCAAASSLSPPRPRSSPHRPRRTSAP